VGEARPALRRQPTAVPPTASAAAVGARAAGLVWLSGRRYDP